MVALTNYVDMVKTSIAEKADVIFAGAGLPLDLPSFLKEGSTTLLVPIVSSARAAKVLCDKWYSAYNYLPDAIVVEGPKAGGHLGFKRNQINDQHFELEELIPQVVEVAKSYSSTKDIPVIAAGGIMTGEDISRFMKLGASAVQMGSIFVPTFECDASDVFKQAYIDAKEDDAVIINSPVGMPGRALKGIYIDKIDKGLTKPKGCAFHCIRTCDYTKSAYCIVQSLYQAAMGHTDKGYVFAGARAYLTEKISSVKEVVTKLEAEFTACKAK